MKKALENVMWASASIVALVLNSCQESEFDEKNKERRDRHKEAQEWLQPKPKSATQLIHPVAEYVKPEDAKKEAQEPELVR